MNSNDPLNDALRVLRDRDWSSPAHRAQLEETLMNEFATNTATHRRRRIAVGAGIGILALAGVGFASAGGLSLVKNWFVTTEVNGQVVDTREVTPDEDGNASFTVDTKDGRTADVNVQQQEGGRKQVTVDLSAGAGSGTYTVTTKEGGGD